MPYRALHASRPTCLVLALALIGCGDRGDSLPLGPPVESPDTLTPPVDTTTPPPTDTVPPPEPTPPPPPGPPVHEGIPFGPSMISQGESSSLLQPPSSLDPNFTALKLDAFKKNLLNMLEAARRANGRVLVSFSGASGE